MSTAVRAVGALTAVLFAGGLLFVTVLWPGGAHDRRTRLVLTITCLVGGAAALAGLHGALDALDTGRGRLAVALPLLWLLAGVVLSALLQRGTQATVSLGWRLAAVAVGFGLIRITTMAWHAEDGRWGAVLSTIHLVAVAVWLGGLAVVLAGLLPHARDTDGFYRAIRRFTRWALVAVIAIAGTGALLAWRLAGSWRAIFDTDRGELLAKLIASVLLLAIAVGTMSWVDRRLRPAVAPQGDRVMAVRPLVVAMATETVLLLAALVAATLLVTAVPGR